MQVGELYFRSRYSGGLGATDYTSCLVEVNSQPLDWVFRGQPVEISFSAKTVPLAGGGGSEATALRQLLERAGYSNIAIDDNSGTFALGRVVVRFTTPSDRGSVQHLVGETLDMAQDSGFVSVQNGQGKTERKSAADICGVWQGKPPLGTPDKIDVGNIAEKVKETVNNIGWPVWIGAAALLLLFKS